ncbi:uncharacterized protein PAC_16855 [Phialocephala subalpina]|uniref:Uncharacterized protein n=1 Tax=Phialocephala subalpina TaxID=576137 RepID=A0A1L7XPI3_9HELO|nr:uncharacterized protein PAC_16855 [Phialocephala subalpina]
MFQQIIAQLLLVSLAMAEETLTTASHGNSWKYGTGGGVLGFAVLILDIMCWSQLPFLSSYVLCQPPFLKLSARSGSPQVQPPTLPQAPLMIDLRVSLEWSGGRLEFAVGVVEKGIALEKRNRG